MNNWPNVGFVLSIVLVVMGLIVALMLTMIVLGTIRKQGRFGVNTELPDCPNCGEQVPLTRKPTSFRQAMWGGWTCEKCGTEMNKWGKQVGSSNK
jgi:hypothetical protein